MLTKKLSLSGITILFILQIIAIPYAFADEVVGTITLGTSPLQIAINPITNIIYSTHNANTILVMDGSNNEILDTIDIGSFPRGIAVNPTTNTIYVTNPLDNTISVIGGDNNTVVDIFEVNPLPRGIAVNPTTNTIYVTHPSEKIVSVIDGFTFAIIETINMGTLPRGIAVNPTTNTIYVTHPLDNTISVIDGSDNSVTDTIEVVDGAFGIAVNPETNTIYSVSCFYENDTISIIDGSSNLMKSSMELGHCTRTIAVNPLTNSLYISDLSKNTISVIEENTQQKPADIAPQGFGFPNSESIEISNGLDSIKKTEAVVEPTPIQITENYSQYSPDIPTFFGIIVTIAIFGVISIKKLRTPKSKEFIEKIENNKETEEQIRKEKKSIVQKIHERFGNSHPEIVRGIDLEQIIENKLRLIFKLQECSIGDKNRLESIKELLITDGVFTKKDNDYIEKIYEQYKKIALIND